MIVGVDFGTTNSVVSVLGADGVPSSVQFGVGEEVFDVFRTVLTFREEVQGRSRRVVQEAGWDAIRAYQDDPLSSRLIMSMKSYLAQRSFVQTNIYGRLFRLEDMVATFLKALLRAGGLGAGDAAPGLRVVAGRPVRFAGEAADDALGEARLRASYAAAGLPDVWVALEPEAAGYRFMRRLRAPATVLVGDFGGGTSDFSLFRFEPGAGRGVTQLGHAGIGIAGDSFDRRLLDRIVAPALGKDDTYRIMGKDMPIPVSYYRGLAQWHRLSLMRTPKLLAEIRELARTSSRPERLEALLAVIEDEAGYELYRAIAGLKAQLTAADEAEFSFLHGQLSIRRRVRRAEFEEWIAGDVSALAATVDGLMSTAGVPEEEVDHVFLTGGTSLVPAVRGVFQRRFPAGAVSGGGEFVSVADGLALIGGDRAAAAGAGPAA